LPLWKPPPFKLYCNGGVPPLAVTVRVVDPPKHAIVPADADAEIAVGCVTVTLLDVAVHVGVLTRRAVTVYVPAGTVNVLLAWNVPPFRLYSTDPAAPEAVAVSVVVPPKQAIVPAEAVTERLHPATTWMVLVELLFELSSPFQLPPGVQLVAALNWPIMVEGPPTTSPCIFISNVTSELPKSPTKGVPLLQILIEEPELDIIVHPAGN